MKFLKDERIEREHGEVKLTIKPVTTSQQARLVDLGSLSGTSARIELTRWCLKNCIEKVSINGTEYEPDQLADRANLADEGTLMVMIKIGGLVCDCAFPKEEEVKK